MNNKKNNEQYNKMLNNLLGVKSRDNAVFSSSKTDNHDLTKLLTPGAVNKAFSNKTFKVEIKDINSSEGLKSIKDISDVEKFIETCDEFDIFLSIADRKLLRSDFTANKRDIISKLEANQSKKVNKWKKFRNKYRDKQSQTNSWPLFVGSHFIQVRSPKAQIYAPLLLKKVEIEIGNDNKVMLKTLDGGIEYNQKVLFLLKESFGINIPKLKEDEDYSIEDVTATLKEVFYDVVAEKDIDFKSKFVLKNKAAVKNADIQFAPGLVLTILSPGGGSLRSKMQDILNNNEMDKILDFDPLIDVKKEITKNIENKAALFRITQTDFSQEKAILGSLADNAIIWGPPGTGKSQTIANILANLLEDGSSVLVTSEKKAALDVIQKRMDKLAKFMFFGLTDKNVSKEEFYKPFQELISGIIKIRDEHSISKQTPKTYILESEWNYIESAKVLHKENVESLSDAKRTLDKYPKVDSSFDKYYSSIKSLPKVAEAIEYETNIYKAFEQAEVKKTGLFKRYPKEARDILKLMKETGGDLDLITNIYNIKDKKNYHNYAKSLNTEVKFSNQRGDYKSDIDYLERLLLIKFYNRLTKMQKDPKFGKQVNTFIKNITSGYRIPYKFVRIYKDILINLFDVFVSTPQTLASTIDMNFEYDYVIFDEASQLHLEKAIPFIYIAKKSVIAGDNEQMRPTNYFGIRDNSKGEDEMDEDAESLLDYAYRKRYARN